METLLLEYSPNWRSQGATVHCGCGQFRHYAWKQDGHRWAKWHSGITRHQTFVQVREFKLGRLDWILPSGQIEEAGDCS